MGAHSKITDGLPKTRTLRDYITLGFGFIIALSIIIGTVLGLLAFINSDGEIDTFSHLLLLPFVTAIYVLIGLQISAKYPNHTIAWLLLVVGLCSGLTFVSISHRQFHYFVLPDSESIFSPFLSWLNQWIWWIPSMLPLSFVLLYFPDGRLPSKRWRPLAIITAIALTGGIIATAFHPGPLPDYGVINTNPYGIKSLEAVLLGILDVSSVLLGISFVGCVASVIFRYRRAGELTRIQLKWLVYAVCLVSIGMGIFIVLWLTMPEPDVIVQMGINFTTVSITLIIIAIGIAILKHQLWDIDILINQTLVYTILSITTVGVYLIVVTILSSLFAGDNLVYSLIATGIIAVSFQTFRSYVQGLINQLMFGNRDDPYLVIERLSRQLEPVVAVDEVLPTIVQSIGSALRLPYVAIAFAQDERYKVTARYPQHAQQSQDASFIRIALDYQSEHIGQLWLAPREQGTEFTEAELNLLQTIARQASIAAYNVRLTDELQRSREDIIITREEERRRLRRDLHDGLGPVLATMSFRLDAVNNLIYQNPNQARAVVGEIKDQVQLSLTEIRRIAYQLRPPALDELGLVGAVQEHILMLNNTTSTTYTMLAPETSLELSAAVEVATYRIVMEAVTNVEHHAKARNCSVVIKVDNHLILDIQDDGCGIQEKSRKGVGITSMQERAEELGGQFQIRNQPSGGTHIHAELPLLQSQRDIS